jgi:uncharacterized membrane protein HdeD (DUF308 family)
VHASAYVASIRQHTSAYVGIREHSAAFSARTKARRWQVCVLYIYVCIYIHTCIHIHTYIRMLTYAIYMHTYIHICTYIRMLTYASYVFIYRDAHLPAALLAAY